MKFVTNYNIDARRFFLAKKGMLPPCSLFRTFVSPSPASPIPHPDQSQTSQAACLRVALVFCVNDPSWAGRNISLGKMQILTFKFRVLAERAMWMLYSAHTTLPIFREDFG